MAENDNRIGTLIVFKEDVTKEEAEEALKKIADLIDENYQYPHGLPEIKSFDGRYGGPVWYEP